MSKKKVKFKKKKLLFLLIIVLVIIGGVVYITKKDIVKFDDRKDNIQNQNKEKEITDFKDMTLDDVKEYTNKKKLELNIAYDYNDEVEKDKVIESKIEDGKVDIKVSLGSIPLVLPSSI